MTGHAFTFCGSDVVARPSGCLWIAPSRTLCVSDLHLGKSGRIARRSGYFLPPYETTDTLARLAQEIAATYPARVICLGDSFDDLRAAEERSEPATRQLAQMQAGREWIWIEGNHDAGPVAISGSHLWEYRTDNLMFRHIATADPQEVSGHYHPKYGIPGGGAARACFVYDDTRLIMPAFGTYTGGLSATDPAVRTLFGARPIAVLTGPRAIPVPVQDSPRQRRSGGRFY